MDGIWIGLWAFVGLFIFVASIIGATKQYESIIFYVGRNLMILYWKRNKKWPVELKYIDIGGLPATESSFLSSYRVP